MDVTLISTTNYNFHYLQGHSELMEDFNISTRVRWGSFYTSRLKSLEYEYFDDYITLTAITSNSTYIFELTDTPD